MSNKDAVRKVLDQVKADKRTSLTAPEGKVVCDAYGIPVPKEDVAKSAADAAKIAGGMGFPVVMKIVSPDILHKTEAGGVIVGVKDAASAEKSSETILANAKKYKADAKIEGVQVQQMLAGGTEVIVGSITDGSFGKLVAFGLGGVLVEVLKDVTFRLAAATQPDAASIPSTARRWPTSSSRSRSSSAISRRSSSSTSIRYLRRRGTRSPPTCA